ncbi:unnamed protein product [Microthlaspi erraticum]|uniref:Uncharacterized protein n=1 Tax=Microthlaspi erraticum TaxID=1685480 RepID=A0A6D2HRF7_9BRAS|nr:unnamed protein product [Microthlaspi erraticum]
MNPSVVAAHKRIGLLQKFNKWQGKAIEKMQKSMDKMVSKIKSLEKKVSGSSSKKKKSKAPTFPRSRSLLTTPRRLPAQEPHRASSFEPREGEDNTQRRRKTSKARRSSSTTGLDRVQTEETQLDRADGRADQEEPQFEDPGFEYDPMPYQEPPRSRWNPYGQYELAMLIYPYLSCFYQGQNSKEESKWSKKSQITKFPSLEHQNLHFSLKTKPEHPKYDRIFMPSRRPKVMFLIWKDRYLSHDPRRSGKRSFGSLVGPELIFYQDMSDERLSRAHGDFDGSRGPRYRAQGLGSS